MFFPIAVTLNTIKIARLIGKKLRVCKGVLFEDSLDNYLNRESTSICQFLYFLCIDDIAKHVERTFYTNKSWYFKYSVSSMTKLFIVKCFRNLSFDKTISSLTEEEAILLSFYDETGHIKLPSGGTLHHFVKYRFGEEGVNDIMMLLGEIFLKLSSAKEAKIDSTPHYGCKMDKAHITIVRTYTK
ncbi:hypothetical protein [Methanosarcina siciliae]